MTTFVLPASAHSRPGHGRELNVLGDHLRVRLSAAATEGQAFAFEQVNEPGFGIPMHTHTREDEMFHILSGRIRFETVDPRTGEPVSFEGGAGDMVWLPRDLPHGFTIVGDGPCHSIVTVTPGGMQAMFEELSDLTIAADGRPDFGDVATLCERYGVTIHPPRA